MSIYIIYIYTIYIYVSKNIYIYYFGTLLSLSFPHDNTVPPFLAGTLLSCKLVATLVSLPRSVRRRVSWYPSKT